MDGWVHTTTIRTLTVVDDIVGITFRASWTIETLTTNQNHSIYDDVLFPTYATRGGTPSVNMAVSGCVYYSVYVFYRIEVKDENYNHADS